LPPADKYYAREDKKYAKEHRMLFKNAQEVERALEFLSRHFRLPYLEVKHRPAGAWSYFRPKHYWHKSHFDICADHRDLVVIAHEFAHYLDYENALKDGRWGVRGLPQPYFRWHSKKHAALVEECVALLKRRLGE